MQIKIDMKILIFALIFFLANQIKIYIVLMIFAFLHEIGHIFIGTILGFKVYLFEIKPLGFCVSFNNPIKDYNIKILKATKLEIKKIFIYMAGPIFNISIAIIVYFLHISDALKYDIIYINLILALGNLIPIYPLDGGRIIKSVICLFKGIKKADILTEKISYIVIIIFLVLSSILFLKVQNIGLLLVVVYIMLIKIKETTIFEKRMKLYELVYNQNGESS